MTTPEEDLALVCGKALEWAGEYGWNPAARPEAVRVLQAVQRLAPDVFAAYERQR